ncbi:MAG: glycosyltransferase [Saprospiraceae bacterium]|nr:glycosyltransferase [Saprospiraceae bacterium]
MAAIGKKVFVLTESDYASADEIKAFDQQQQAMITIIRNQRLSNWRMYLNRLQNLKKLIRQYKPEALLVSGKFSLWAGAWLKLLQHRTPVWAFLHGSELQLKRRWERRLTNWSLARLDRLFPVSQFTCQLLSQSLQAKSKIVPNGLITKELLFHQSITPFSDWKGTPRLLTVGSITLRKGQHRAVKALPTFEKNILICIIILWVCQYNNRKYLLLLKP